MTLLFALLMLSGEPRQVADDADRLHAVIVRSDGRAAPVALPLSEDATADVRELWIWSDESAPVKIEGNHVRALALSEIEKLLEGDPRRITFRVTPKLPDREAAAAELIAAPVEMWHVVPEPLLPRFRLGKEQRPIVPRRGSSPVRARVIADRRASSWIEVPASRGTADVALMQAGSAVLALELGDDAVVADATVAGMRGGEPLPTLRARYAADREGNLSLPPIPDDEHLQLIITASGYAPAAVRGHVSQLGGRRIRLERGIEVGGRITDTDDEPLQDVTVTIESWIASDSVGLYRESSRTDAAGHWVLRSVPGNEIALQARKPGYATYAASLKPDASKVVLGPIVMRRSATLKLNVVDVSDSAIRGARVRAGRTLLGTADADGSALIELSPDSEAELRVDAEGFQEKALTVPVPFPEEMRVTLTRAFRVVGMVRESDGRPIDDATIRIESGSSYRAARAASDGRFEVTLPPGEPATVTFETPRHQPVSLVQDGGAAGESRDIGPVVLPGGAIIRGHVVSAAGEPVPSARVWVLRPASNGPLAAWLANRTAEASTDASGAFELQGLAEGPVLIRVDAAGFARAHLSVLAGEIPLDPEPITLARGATVTVTLPKEHREATARIDLRGEWLDLDMMTAPVVDRRAMLRAVPPGEHLVTVIAGPSVLCEKNVEVAGDDDVEVECSGGVAVAGDVLVGTTRAAGGALTWSRGDVAGTQGVIMNTSSPLGATRQQAFGIGRGAVVSPVDAAGRFRVDGLAPGEWRVSWSSNERELSEAVTVQVPDVEEFRTTIRFRGSFVRGRVVDESGRAVAGAHVRVGEGAHFAISRPDGSFGISGIADGVHRFTARLGSRSSLPRDVEVASGRPVGEVILRLEERDEGTLEFSVTGAGGEPAAGAFVFVSTAAVTRILTADRMGKVTTTLDPELRGASLSAYWRNRWAFGTLDCDGDSKCRVPLTIRPSGALLVKAAEDVRSLLVIAPNGADVAAMLARLGFAPVVTPSSPLSIQGLPAGAYTVSADGGMRVVNVAADRAVEVTLP
jgi:hypothetical protein